jgi:hypothetical protein
VAASNQMDYSTDASRVRPTVVDDGPAIWAVPYPRVWEAGLERRQSTRYPLCMKAGIHSVGAKALPEAMQTWTRDVSSKGVSLVFADPPPEIGALIHLTIDLPSDVIGKTVALKCVARVVRVLNKNGCIAVGSLIERRKFVRGESCKRPKPDPPPARRCHTP